MPFGSVKLNDGNEVPAIAFGTGSSMKFKDVSQYVEQAFEAGFSHIDTAQFYGTEEYVGVAIKEEGLKRDEIYVTSKYSGEGAISEAIKQSLNKLKLKYLDLYLIHNPALIRDSYEATWGEFEKIKNTGLAKSIGVSNFNLKQLQELNKVARIKPAVNQIRLHPYNWAQNEDVVEYCKQEGIIIEAYSSLAPITQYPGGPVDSVLDKIGERINATPAQVIFAWLRSKGAIIVTTSTKESRLKEYLAVADLPELTEDEIATIEQAGARGPSLLSTLSLLPSQKYTEIRQYWDRRSNPDDSLEGYEERQLETWNSWINILLETILLLTLLITLVVFPFLFGDKICYFMYRNGQ